MPLPLLPCLKRNLIIIFLNFWACLFSFIGPCHTHKLNFRSQECSFLGYSSSHMGYKCLSSSSRVYISKDVLFNELRFPYFDLFPTSTSSITNFDSYFSLNPNLSPPFVSSIPQTSQVSCTTYVPLVPPRFSHL